MDKQDACDLFFGVLVLLVILIVVLSLVPYLLQEYAVNQMCSACYVKGWKGMIEGELTYSCDIRDWCYENSKLFPNFNE